MFDELNMILDTLNTVSVSGEQNLNRLLGCIQHLRKVLQEIQQSTKEDEP